MMEELKFGPPGDEWVYDRETKVYDLGRGKPPLKYSMRTIRGVPGTSIALAPALSALVVVDMQNFFLHPRCNDHPSGLAAVKKTIQVVEQCREIGIKVIWLNWGLNEEDVHSMPAATQRSFSSSVFKPSPDDKRGRYGFGSDMGDGRGRLLMAGEWNSELYESLQDAVWPREDVFCNKNRISGLWHSETPLAKALVDGGIRTLLFAGVNTDQCVLGTLSDAYYRGYDCIMVEDCCATPTPGGQDVSIYNTSVGNPPALPPVITWKWVRINDMFKADRLQKLFGFVIDTKSFLECELTRY